MNKCILVFVFVFITIMNTNFSLAFTNQDARIIMMRALAFEFTKPQIIINNLNTRDVFFPASRNYAYSSITAKIMTRDGNKFSFSPINDFQGNNFYTVEPENGEYKGFLFNYDYDGNLFSFEQIIKPEDSQVYPIIRAIYFPNGNFKKVVVLLSNIEGYYFLANKDFEGHFFNGSVYSLNGKKTEAIDF